MGAPWEAGGPAGRRRGRGGKSPWTQRSPGPGWRRGARAGRREWARTRALRVPWRRGGCAPVGCSAGEEPSRGERVDTKLRAGSPSGWRVTPLSVAPTGGGGTVGNPENPGDGGEGGEGSTVVSAAVAFRSVSVFLSWVAPDCPPSRHPRTATSPSPVVSFPLVLSPTFHSLLLG